MSLALRVILRQRSRSVGFGPKQTSSHDQSIGSMSTRLSHALLIGVGLEARSMASFRRERDGVANRGVPSFQS
jgi:hypothetical protein